MAGQAYPVRDEACAAGMMLCGRQPPLRIDERAQIFKPIGRHQSGGGKFPERVLNAAGELARVFDDIREK